MRNVLLPLAACLLVAGAPTGLEGQAPVHRYQVTATLGAQWYDGSSALELAAAGGVDASLFITPNLAVGLYGQVARPRTDPSFYPVVRLNYGAVTEYHQPSQHVTSYAAGVQGRLLLRAGALAPYVLAGAGLYAFTLDPEQNRSDESKTGVSLAVGGGVHYELGGGTGVLVEIRDLVFLDYDRDWFDLSDPLLEEPRFPHPDGEPPAKESTIHNLRLSVGFTFIPGGGR